MFTKEEKAGPVLMAVGKPGEPAIWIVPKPKRKINWWAVILAVVMFFSCAYLMAIYPA